LVEGHTFSAGESPAKAQEALGILQYAHRRRVRRLWEPTGAGDAAWGISATVNRTAAAATGGCGARLECSIVALSTDLHGIGGGELVLVAPVVPVRALAQLHFMLLVPNVKTTIF